MYVCDICLSVFKKKIKIYFGSNMRFCKDNMGVFYVILCKKNLVIF